MTGRARRTRRALTRAFAALVLTLPATAVTAAQRPKAPAPLPLPPVQVLRHYVRALAVLPRPRRVSFQYSVEQLGLRNLEQTHRVYRAGSRERDETLDADGSPLLVPSVRIFDDRTNRYEIAAVAPQPQAYDFTSLGSAHGVYMFETHAREPRAFTVTAVGIDARSFLPVSVRFRIAGNGVVGSGELRYGRAERYWMIRQAQVTARLANGARAHERIAWSAYQFPVALPPATFALPSGTSAPAPVTPL